MRIAAIPGKLSIVALISGAIGILIVSLNMGLPVANWSSAAFLAALVGFACIDYFRSWRIWRAATPQLQRHLPAALAVGVRCTVPLRFFVGSDQTRAVEWHILLFDRTDPTLAIQGMPIPVAVTVNARKQIDLMYSVVPTRRGEVVFAAADVRIRSRWRLWELLDRCGAEETRRVFPDFAQIARYAWLAGDRRLAEIGIKTYQQRGEGTDFKQLSEYRMGDAVRHIDWKATLRFGKPIVREFQNERDQCVLLLIDCGRRMRADDRVQALGNSHFDQVLNAAMLLTYVALKHGDAVGAMTFGTPIAQQRWIAPRKGFATLNALMGELYSIQATPTHSDYLTAAKDVMRRQRKRALVIVISNFRDEDATELDQALRLLRTRHLVLTASLRERIVSQLISQPLKTQDALLEIASAHLYEQTRRDAFNRVAAHDKLMVDAEPERLSIELVNRYNAIKRAGLV
jgi:uncharacterized protein (DUF58 family)